MNISSSWLQTFLRILDDGGVGAAARSLGLSQPTLSSTLARLERELGMRLFERTSNGLVPTRAGRALEPIARRSLAAKAQFDDLARAVREGLEGSICIAVQDGHLYSAFVPALVGALHRLRPLVQLHVSVQPDLDSAVRLVASGRADLLITDRAVTKSGLQSEQMPPRPLALVIPPQHDDPATIDRLLESALPVPLITSGPEDASILKRLGLETRVVAAVPYTLVGGLVLQGVGCAIVAESFALLLARAGAHVVLLDEPALRAFVTVREEAHPPAVRDLVNAAREVGRTSRAPFQTADAPRFTVQHAVRAGP